MTNSRFENWGKRHGRHPDKRGRKKAPVVTGCDPCRELDPGERCVACGRRAAA